MSEPVIREDVYGRAKRLRVFREWIDEVRRNRGGATLSILDFGCGTGTFVTRPLALDGNRVHGVDMHPPSIAWAQTQANPQNLTYGTETLEQMAARGDRYDVVICSEVLEHSRSPGELLSGLQAILAGDGLLIVTVPNGYGPFENLQRLDRLLRRVGVAQVVDFGVWSLRAAYWVVRGRGVPPRPGAPPAAPTGAGGYLNIESGHVQFFRLADLQRLFAGAGFHMLERRGLVFLCGPYVDFWAFFAPRFLLELNGCLAEVLPFGWAADWMFRLHPESRARAGA